MLWYMLFVKHCEDDQLKEDELGGACSKYFREEKCMNISGLDSE
jgi:hypothetical protein